MPDTTVRQRTLAVNGIDLRLTEAGDDGPVVVLAHGFPELAYSWRHQLPALAAAGYRVVAPDQRGYGGTTIPDAVDDYDIVHLTDDLLGVLADLGAEQAVFVGHDWGSMVVTTMATLHPERVQGLVNMSVPFVPRGPIPPITAMRNAMGDMFFYMLYFQEPGIADKELGDDAARTMRRMLCGARVDAGAAPDPSFFVKDGRGFIDRMPEADGLPDWLSQEELDHYIAEFSRTGFTGGINWYRNLDRNWELTPQAADAHVHVPSLFIGGTADPVLMMSPPAIAHEYLDDHRGDVLVDGAGHWVQQESPDAVNAALLDFLASTTNKES
jgi:pimeloyl-ACP methyl ester carboxylesterase